MKGNMNLSLRSVYILLILTLTSLGVAWGQATGDYRSATSGNWNSIATWERFNAGSWEPAAASPTNADGAITIQNGHVVTITANVTADQILVSAGGQVILNSGTTLTLNNGTGTDLTVSGTFTNAGTVTINASATIAYNAGGVYQHNFTTTAGTIPSATWNAASTVEIIGYTTNGSSPSGIGQTFGNFTWNCPGQTTTLNPGGGLANMTGSLSIISTGTGAFKLVGSTSPTITIGGNFTMSGGNFTLTSGTGTPNINLAGNFTLNGGTMTMSENTGGVTLNVSGDFSHTAGTLRETGSSVPLIRFAKAGTQNFTSGGTVTNTINFTVNSGSTLNMGTNIVTSAGTFTLSSGATLGIGSPDGITSSGATGNIQSTGRSFNTGASYTYNGSSAQVTGNGLPATISNLTVDNPAGLTLEAAKTISGNVLINQGTLTTNNFNLSVAGNWTNNGGFSGGTSTITFTGAAKTIDGSTSTAFPTLSIAAGASATLNTNTSCSTLNFVAGSTASSLTHSGATILSVTGNATVNQPTASVIAGWNINAGSATVGGNLTVGGTLNTSTQVAQVLVTSGSLTVNGTTTISTGTSSAVGKISVDTGTLTFASALTHNEGTLVFLGAGTMNFNGAYSFASGGSATPIFTTVAGANLNFGGNLTSSGSGGLTLNATSNTSFTGTTTVTPTTALTFGNVTLNSGSAVTINGNVTVAGNWTNNGGTLSADSNTMTLTGAAKTIGGTASTTFPILSIGSGASTTMNNSNSCAGLTFVASSTASSFSHNATSALTVIGNVTINQPTASFTTAWNINQGYASVSGNVNIGGSNTTTTRVAKIVVTTGSLSIGGNLVYNSSATTAQTAIVDLSTGGGTATLNLAGAMTLTNNTGTLTPGGLGSIVNYNGSASGQIVRLGSAITYHNLHLNNMNAAGATLGAAISASNVTGNLRIQSGTLDNAGFAIVGNAAKMFEVANGATFKLTGSSGMVTGFGTKTFGTSSMVNYAGTGAQTVSAENYGNLTLDGTHMASNLTLPSSGTVGIAGTLIPSATFTTGNYVITGSTINFNGAGAQTIPEFDYNNLIISGARGSNNVTLVNGGTIGIAGTFSPTAAFSGGGYIRNGNTINFNGASQSIPVFPFFHLATSGSGTKTPAEALSLDGGLSIGGGTTFSAGSFSHSIKGDFANVGIFTASTGTIILDGTGIQTVVGAGLTFNNLTINNLANISLNGASPTVNDTLALTNGTVTTGIDTVVLGASGIVTRSNGWVNGNLRKHVGAGSPSVTFELGDLTRYTPVDISFVNVTTPGTLTAHSTTGDHPNISLSGIKGNKSVNRYWTLSNTGTGFDSYDATFHFDPADVDGSANTGNFIVKKYNTPTWSLTTTGTRTSTSTQATGLTSFSDFAVGEGGAAFPPTSLVDASPKSITANGTATSTITIQLKDDQGNNITSGGDSVTAATTLGSLGSITDNGNGTYTAILTSGTATGAAIVTGTANGGQITDNDTVQFTPGPASVATSTIIATPTAIVANGTDTSHIVVQLKDQFGNNLITSGDTVALNTNLGTLNSVINLNNGTYFARLTSSLTLGNATITGTLNGNAIADNEIVAFTTAQPSILVWTHEPKDTVAGTPIPSNSPLTVEVRDALGNLVPTATNAVTISIGTNPGAGTLSGTATKNAVGGIVTFTDLSINKSANGYTLISSSGSLTPDTSATFSITPASATQIGFGQQPTTTIADQVISPPVTVRMRDVFGNNVPMAGTQIDIALTSGTGVLAGTVTRFTDSSGAATFDDLRINTQGGGKRLTASSTGYTSVQSNIFTINPQPSNLLSDDFNSFDLSPMWTFHNPFGAATQTMTGTNTPNAAVTMAVPITQAHDLGAGILYVPRIMQNSNNTDFQVEVKWLTGVSSRFQLQGVVVEQDSNDYMRIEFNSDAIATKTFVGSIVNGVQTQLANFTIAPNGAAPTFMRVRRTGDNWTQFYSTDGVAWTPSGTWTRAMTVNRVGPYVGNLGTPIPAHTGSLDYFMNTASPILSEDGTTAVDSVPPVITNIQVSTGDTNATFTWNTGEQSTSAVSYGLTAAYELGSITDTSKVTSHTINLGGLTVQTPYHFRVSSADIHGNTRNSPDSTFATKDSFLVASDDFNTFSLKNFWTFVNPQGDGSLQFTGQNTSNARAVISVPAGIAHESWTSGNNSVRLVQNANNRDFEVEAKFESGVSQSFQEQGIIIEQDNSRFLRFEFYSNGTNTKIFAGDDSAGIGVTHLNSNIGANAIAPLYMRVKRLGNQWTQQYSFNGTTWTSAVTFVRALAVTKVGPYAGNAGSTPSNAPAFTANIDYFFKTNRPVNPEDGSIAIDDVPPVISSLQTSTTGTTATITWLTNELTRSSVSYGPTSGYENGTVSDSVLRTSHSFLLKNLNPASFYHFRVSSKDSSNNNTNSNDSTFTTGAASTIVSDDFNTFILNTSRWTYFNPRNDATLTMNNTNTDSARVFIAIPGGIEHQPWTGGNFAPRLMQPMNNADLEIEVKFESAVSQKFQLQGIVVEQDQNNYLRFDINSDAINTKAFAGGVIGGTATTKIANTTIGSNGVVPQYMRVRREGNVWTQSYSLNGTTWTTVGSFTQVLAPDSIGPFIGNSLGTTIPAHTGKIDYFFNTRSPISPEDGGIAPDPLPPVISNIQVTRTATTATITWSTNEPANSAVSHGATTAYENGTVVDSARVLSHAINLTGLTNGATYHFKVTSADSTGNVANSNDSTFTLLPPSTIVSDDFNQATLNTSLWTFFNPLGDATLSMNSTSTDSARMFISVPAGVTHQPWTGGNLAPRVMQASNNTDFEVQIKFESPVSQRFRMQGMIAEQDQRNYIRFDIESDLTNTRAFAANIVNDTATQAFVPVVIGAGGIPLQYMRVKRLGDQWTMSYSLNGTSWTQAGTFARTLTIDSVGVFIGNAGTTPSNSPAHVGKVDYFFNTASPIVPEDGTVDTTAPVISNVQTVSHLNSFQVSWNTNENANGLVEYGLTTSYELGAVSDTNRILSHTLQVPGLQSGTLYNFRITAKDSLNNTRVSSDFTVRTFGLLTANTVGSGSVAKNPDSANGYPFGQIVGLKATANAGWHFIGWSGDTTTTSDTLAIEMNGNRTVTAAFDTNRILTVNVTGNGSVTRNPNQGIYSTGQIVGLKAVPDSGWHFIGWSGDTTATADTIAIAMNSNRSVTATFTQNLILTTNIVGSGSVTRNPDLSSYVTGQVVTLTAVPGLGWLFSGWSGDTTSSTNPIDVTMSSNKTVTATFTLIPPVVANVKAFLQGPYDASGDSMKTDLRNLSLLPLSQPYSGSPWNYGGTEAVGSIPAGVVDWVLLELRPSSDSTQVLAIRAGFITKSGTVVDTNGTAPVGFSGQADGDYYVVVRHRNHLGVMSAIPLPLTTSSTLYDFTTAQSQAYGSDPETMLEAGVFGLRGGDGNADGGVDAIDRNLVWRIQNGTAWDYTKLGDFNLDGGIDAPDLNLYWRPNNGTATQVPSGGTAAKPNIGRKDN